MKLMNEVKADVEGSSARSLVENTRNAWRRNRSSSGNCSFELEPVNGRPRLDATVTMFSAPDGRSPTARQLPVRVIRALHELGVEAVAGVLDRRRERARHTVGLAVPRPSWHRPAVLGA
jgi:hypothetical protein